MKRGNNPYNSLISFISRFNISTKEEIRLREIIAEIKKFDQSIPVTGESEAIGELLNALQGLVNDVKNKPNDTRYATHIKIAESVIEKYKQSKK